MGAIRLNQAQRDYADPGPSPVPRPLALAADLAVVYPVLAVSALYAEWLVAWAVLGHQPRVSLDDPKDIPGSAWLGLVTFLALLGLFPAGCAAMVLTVLHAMSAERRGRRLVVQILGLLTLWPGAFALIRWDPLRVMEWWID
jgi:hypothetical protein